MVQPITPPTPADVHIKMAIGPQMERLALGGLFVRAQFSLEN